jgi:hypothetical protein
MGPNFEILTGGGRFLNVNWEPLSSKSDSLMPVVLIGSVFPVCARVYGWANNYLLVSPDSGVSASLLSLSPGRVLNILLEGIGSYCV